VRGEEQRPKDGFCPVFTPHTSLLTPHCFKKGHSISAGLDYPGVGPEHSHLNDIGRAEYAAISDDEALDAFKMLTEMEGIIPALESSHAIAEVIKMAPKMNKDQIILVCLSGRGDKDMHTVAEAMGIEL